MDDTRREPSVPALLQRVAERSGPGLAFGDLRVFEGTGVIPVARVSYDAGGGFGSADSALCGAVLALGVTIASLRR